MNDEDDDIDDEEDEDEDDFDFMAEDSDFNALSLMVMGDTPVEHMQGSLSKKKQAKRITKHTTQFAIPGAFDTVEEQQFEDMMADITTIQEETNELLKDSPHVETGIQ